MNGAILKSQKLLTEQMSNQQQLSEINCPMNVVSFAQIAFKKRIFQARPANAHYVFILHMCIGLVRFLWEIWLFLLEGGTIPPCFSHS